MGSRSTTKDFPGFDKLFYLGESGSSRAFRGKVNVGTDSFGLTRAEVRPEQPLIIPWAMGQATPGHVIWTTMGTMVIVSDAVVQLLLSHGFTGWTLYDVSVRDKQGQEVPGYHGFAITGRCGDIDWSRGIEEPRVRPARTVTVWRGLFFDPESWDGSDFFMPDSGGQGYKLMVEPVKRAFERAKIRNVEFTPLDQFERTWKL